MVVDLVAIPDFLPQILLLLTDESVLQLVGGGGNELALFVYLDLDLQILSLLHVVGVEHGRWN